jgi:hypothetical protein
LPLNQLGKKQILIPALRSKLEFFLKVKELRKNQLFFHENWWFFEGFEIPRTSGLFNLDVSEYQNWPVL